LLGRTAGFVAGGLVWISPGALLTVSTLAYPGYALGMAVTVVVALLAVALADDDEPRLLCPAAFGAVAGLGFWIHPMFVAVIAPLVVAVFVIHRRRITDVWLPAIVGAVVGCGPLIVWNAVNGWPSLTDQPDTPGTYTDRFRAIVGDLFPRAFGLKDAQLDWRFGAAIGLVLYAAVIALTAAGAVVLWRREGRRNKAIPVALAATVPLMAALPPLNFPDDGRYAVIAFPFVVVSIAAVVDALVRGRTRTVRVGGPAAIVVVWMTLLVGPAVVDAARTVDENPNTTVEMVRDRLVTAGVDTINGSFWEVLPVDYVADNDLTAAVLPYYSIRFPDEQRAVEATDPDRVAFVFALFDERPDQLWMAVDRYTREQIGEAVLYLPITPPTDGDA
jgi:4-amino-4-deoxy-L-arabinose transferase-like glycosyltransferase